MYILDVTALVLAISIHLTWLHSTNNNTSTVDVTHSAVIGLFSIFTL